MKGNMQLIRRFRDFEGPPTAVAIGNFDGLHLGHRAVIDRMKQAAAEKDLVPAVLTFEPHPRRFFAPAAPQFRLEPLGLKLRRLQEAGVKMVFMPEFNADFAGLGAQAFMDDILADALNAHAVITGEDFAFGKGRSGNVATLRNWGERERVAIHTVAPVLAEGEVCSSSTVRKALEEGDITHARALLGRDYEMTGRVVHGDKRGRALGFPTANIAFSDELKLPKLGVYAVRVQLGDAVYGGAASLGLRPTVGEQTTASLEVFLFDFECDIYGARTQVTFVQYLRPERKFPSFEAMIPAMQEDCVRAREALQAAP
jgi:riboflavin kinase/FMN adenylyltransferase